MQRLNTLNHRLAARIGNSDDSLDRNTYERRVNGRLFLLATAGGGLACWLTVAALFIGAYLLARAALG